jgi:hypothetical protein
MITHHLDQRCRKPGTFWRSMRDAKVPWVCSQSQRCSISQLCLVGVHRVVKSEAMLRPSRILLCLVAGHQMLTLAPPTPHPWWRQQFHRCIN